MPVPMAIGIAAIERKKFLHPLHRLEYKVLVVCTRYDHAYLCVAAVLLYVASVPRKFPEYPPLS